MRAPTVPGEKQAEREDGGGQQQRGGIAPGGSNGEGKIARRRRSQKDAGENDAQPGTGIDGEQRGRGERIARHCLQQQTADRHHRADQERGQNTRQPHRQHHALIERQIGGGRMGERGKHRARTRAFRQKKPGRIQTKRRQENRRQQPFQPRGKRFHARRPG